jgi:AcrR family transcriptional regulator
MAAAQGSGTQLRADAARNRRQIIKAARELYGRRGLDAPLDEIARLAQVGNATLYRHFPSRCALAAAVFADTLSRVIDAASQALADPDPWHAFAGHVRYLAQLQATDRGLADLLITDVTGAPQLEELRSRALQDFTRIADRARVSGALRADFTPEDLVLLLMANAGLVDRTIDAAPTAWSRFIDLALDGLHTPAVSTAASTAPPDRAALQQAMINRGHRLGYG